MLFDRFASSVLDTEIGPAPPGPPRGSELSEQWNTKPSTAPKKVEEPATDPVDPAELSAEIRRLAKECDDLADSAVDADREDRHRSALNAEVDKREEVFEAVCQAVEEVIALGDRRLEQAGHHPKWKFWTRTGFNEPGLRLEFRDIASSLVWDAMQRVRPLRYEADRALAMRILQIRQCVFQEKFVTSTYEILPIYSFLRGDGGVRVAAAESWLAWAADDTFLRRRSSPLALRLAIEKLHPKLLKAPAPTVDTRTAENDGPDLLKAAGYSWNTVKESYASGGNPDRMRACLKLRESVRDRFLGEAIRTAMSRQAEEDPRAPWYWVRHNAAGSDTLTSDIDVSLKGTRTGPVVAIFNRLVAEAYVYEPGYVFDINVYAQDYLPDSGVRLSRDDRPSEDLPVPSSSDYDERFTIASEQDRFALIKIRRYVDEESWRTFVDGVVRGLTVKQGQAFSTLVRDAELEYQELEDRKGRYHQSEHKRLTEVLGTKVLDPEILEMAVSNRCYEALLAVQEYCRATFRADSAAKKSPAVLGSTLLHLYRNMARGNFYANEAYHTAGAHRHVVGVMQSNLLRFTDPGELRDSLNEQLGDIFKEIAHLARNFSSGDIGTDDQPSKFETKISKYVARLGHAGLSLMLAVEAAVEAHKPLAPGRTLVTPDDVIELGAELEDVADYGDALVAFKEGRTVAGLASLRTAARITDLEGLKQRVVDVAIMVNVLIRRLENPLDRVRMPLLHPTTAPFVANS